jgi:DNA gyrase subunit A
VGAFIVVEGDEILSITQNGQVVRSPINDQFRATGRSTMGVKFVTPKGNDAVAVVARSVEAKDEDEIRVIDADAPATESSDAPGDATIDGSAPETTGTDAPGPDLTGESEA